MRSGVGVITIYDIKESISVLPLGVSPALVGGSGSVTLRVNSSGVGQSLVGAVSVQGTNFNHPDNSEVPEFSGYVKTKFGNSVKGRFYLMWSAEKAHTRLPALAGTAMVNGHFIPAMVGSTDGQWYFFDGDGNKILSQFRPTDVFIAGFEASDVGTGITGYQSFITAVSGEGVTVIDNGDGTITVGSPSGDITISDGDTQELEDAISTIDDQLNNVTTGLIKAHTDLSAAHDILDLLITEPVTGHAAKITSLEQAESAYAVRLDVLESSTQPLIGDWTGLQSIPASSTISGAWTTTISSSHVGSGSVRIKLSLSTAGFSLALNGAVLANDFIGASDADTWYDFETDNIISGDNTIAVWSIDADRPVVSVVELRSGAGGYESRIASLEQTTGDQALTLTSLSTTSGNHVGEISTLNQTTGSHTQSIASLVSSDEFNSGEITVLRDTTADQAKQLTALTFNRTPTTSVTLVTASDWGIEASGRFGTPIVDVANITDVTDGVQTLGNRHLYGMVPIPVDVNKKYLVRIRFRITSNSTVGGDSVYAGVATLDGDFNNLTGGAGTHRYCAINGVSYGVANGVVEVSGYIEGVGDLHSNFRAGTKYIRPMVITSYSGGNGTTVIESVHVEDVTQVGLVAERLDLTKNDMDRVKATYTLKMDANGVFAGMGLIADEETRNSVAYFAVDKFALVPPGAEVTTVNQAPFYFDNSQLYVNNATIKNLNSSHITLNAANVGADPAGSANAAQAAALQSAEVSTGIWTRTYNVSDTTAQVLNGITGSPLSTTQQSGGSGNSSYIISATTIGTGTVTGYVARVSWTGSAWGINVLESGGNTSNHPYLYESSGKVKVSHHHSSEYLVVVRIEDLKVSGGGALVDKAVADSYDATLAASQFLVSNAAGALPHYGNADISTIRYNESERAIELYSPVDDTIGMVFPAVQVNLHKGEKYAVSLKASCSDVNNSSGFYIMVSEYNSDLPVGKTHVGVTQAHPAVVEKSSYVWLRANASITTDMVTHEYTYTPSASAKWASIGVLNWDTLGTQKLFVTVPQMQLNLATQDIEGGSVGGWQLTEDKIFSGAGDQVANAFQSADGITLHKSGSITSRNFVLQQSGSAYFRGHVEATTGFFSGALRIGGTTLDDDNTLNANTNWSEVQDAPSSLADLDSTAAGKVDNALPATTIENDVLRVPSPLGGSYSNSTQVIAGAIKVVLPQGWTNTMLRFTVDVFNYATGKSFSVAIGGYLYTVGGYWYNYSAIITGNQEYTVRFGYTGTKACLFIGEANTPWSHLKVTIKDLVAGYGGYEAEKWASGWVISVTTDLSDTDPATVVTDTLPGADWSKTTGNNKPADNATANSDSQINGLADGRIDSKRPDSEYHNANTSYSQVSNTPNSLADINGGEGSKLGGIEDNATANSDSQITGLADSRIDSKRPDSDYHNGNTSYSQVGGTPSSLADINGGEGSKLSGVADNATANISDSQAASNAANAANVAEKSAGKVGGWNVTASYIHTGAAPQTADTFATTGGITLSYTGAIRAKNFHIDNSGNAKFKGYVEAESGRIGSWGIGGTGGNYLYSGANTPGRVPMESDAFDPNGTTININGAFRSKNFRIDNNGDVFIKGHVDALSGSFGGDIIGATFKTNASASSNRIEIDPVGGLQVFSAGVSTPSLQFGNSNLTVEYPDYDVGYVMSIAAGNHGAAMLHGDTIHETVIIRNDEANGTALLCTNKIVGQNGLNISGDCELGPTFIGGQVEAWDVRVRNSLIMEKDDLVTNLNAEKLGGKYLSQLASIPSVGGASGSSYTCNVSGFTVKWGAMDLGNRQSYTQMFGDAFDVGVEAVASASQGSTTLRCSASNSGISITNNTSEVVIARWIAIGKVYV